MAMLFKIKTVFGHLKTPQPNQYVISDNLETLNKFFANHPHLRLTSIKILDCNIKEVSLK